MRTLWLGLILQGAGEARKDENLGGTRRDNVELQIK